MLAVVLRAEGRDPRGRPTGLGRAEAARMLCQGFCT